LLKKLEVRSLTEDYYEFFLEKTLKKQKKMFLKFFEEIPKSVV